MTLVQKAEQFVFDLFKDKLSPSYTYHNFNHTQRVVRAIGQLIATENLTAPEIEALVLAGWFHDTGYTNATRNMNNKAYWCFGILIQSIPFLNKSWF
jgi:predicted metal-dependent HD superfamily phosphohydrolase